MFKLCLVAVILISGSLAQSITTSDDGLEVLEGYFPWSSYIQILNDDTMEYVGDCFGALISPSFVFTLAQCSLEQPQFSYRIHFGSVNFTESAISMMSKNFIIYPTYDPWISVGLDNVGLIELPEPVTFTETIKAISLPWGMVDVNITGMEVYFIGRRHIVNEVSGVTHPIMRWNMLKLISNENCDSLSSFRTERMCSLGALTNPRQTPCSSKGYLVLHRNLDYVLVGGSGIDSCIENFPNFFPRVPQYLNWITNVTGMTPPIVE